MNKQEEALNVMAGAIAAAAGCAAGAAEPKSGVELAAGAAGAPKMPPVGILRIYNFAFLKRNVYVINASHCLLVTRL